MTIFDASGFRTVKASRANRGRGGLRIRLATEILEPRQLLTTITVNTIGDADGADGSATLSLRQAIEISSSDLSVASLTPSQASLVVGGPSTPNIIDFAIPGTGPFIIKPTTALPSLSNSVVIDGYSQPGAHPNTNGPGQGKNTVILIELDGVDAPGADGLIFSTGGCTVQGLAIGGFIGSPSSSMSAGDGILIDSQFDCLIQGNFLGTDASGTRSLPNSVGIEDAYGFIDSAYLVYTTNTIGGTAAGAGNVISGNTGAGLGLLGDVVFTATHRVMDVVQGNFVGTDFTGTKAMPNGGSGIDNAGGGSTIGGTVAGAGNLLSGNGGDGLNSHGNLSLVDNFAFPSGSNDLVQGNLIGTDVTGTHAIPNHGNGISAFGGLVTIGGTAAGAANIIAFNGGSGVTGVSGSSSLATSLPVNQTYLISGNSIFANGGPGISYTMPDDPLVYPAPVLQSVTPMGSGSLITGRIEGNASQPYIIEFFSNLTSDPSGFGQGQTYLGSTLATTDIFGFATFTFTSKFFGQSVSATATHAPFADSFGEIVSGSTSAFSRDLPASTAPTRTMILQDGNQFAMQGQPIRFDAEVASTDEGAAIGEVAFFEDGVILGTSPLDASDVATFVIAKLLPGPHVITADYLGDPTHAASLSSPVNIAIFKALAFGGPAVTSDVFAGPRAVAVTFNRGLSIGPATDLTNYTIVGPHLQAITIVSATYEPITASVTLTTLQPLDHHKTYLLTINGHQGDRVVDVFGIPLNGQKHGKPGHDYSGKITVKKGRVVKVAHPSATKANAHAMATGKTRA